MLTAMSLSPVSYTHLVGRKDDVGRFLAGVEIGLLRVGREGKRVGVDCRLPVAVLLSLIHIWVLNLNRPDRAVVFSPAAEVLETSMDDIEIQIVRGYLEKNRALLED